MAPSLEDAIEKSEAMPVVGPNGEVHDTLMVQTIGRYARCGLPDTQARLEIVVGMPYTGNTYEPFVISDPETLTEMENADVVEEQVVENVYVAPLSVDDGVEIELLVELIVKSAAIPLVAPEAPETDIVHITLPPALTSPVHEPSEDAVVGTP